jgi:hypothetical protein
MAEQTQLPVIEIKRIKELSFQIREDLLTDPSKSIKIEIGRDLSFALEPGLVSLTLRFYYHYAEQTHPLLVDIEVQNVFEIPNLERFIFNGAELRLPPMTISTIVGLSISHARALLAKELSGTVIQDHLPFIVDPTEVAMHFFPRMFEAESAQTPSEPVRFATKQ